MNRGEDFIGGVLIGVFLVLIVTTLVDHFQESMCQERYDVADCTWVSVTHPMAKEIRDEVNQTKENR